MNDTGDPFGDASPAQATAARRTVNGPRYYRAGVLRPGINAQGYDRYAGKRRKRPRSFGCHCIGQEHLLLLARLTGFFREAVIAPTVYGGAARLQTYLLRGPFTGLLAANTAVATLHVGSRGYQRFNSRRP